MRIVSILFSQLDNNDGILVWALWNFLSNSLVCPNDDWVIIQNTCYKFVNESNNFEDAYNICQNFGGKLFKPLDTLVYTLVYQNGRHFLKTNPNVWIGVRTNKTDNWTGNLSYSF